MAELESERQVVNQKSVGPEKPGEAKVSGEKGWPCRLLKDIK